MLRIWITELLIRLSRRLLSQEEIAEIVKKAEEEAWAEFTKQNPDAAPYKQLLMDRARRTLDAND